MDDMTTHQAYAVLERAVKTFAQALAAFIVAGEFAGIVDVSWGQAVSAAALAAVLSMLTSLASWEVGPADGPSAGSFEVAADDEWLA